MESLIDWADRAARRPPLRGGTRRAATGRGGTLVLDARVRIGVSHVL